MRLTLHSDYALRLMMLLAMEPDHRHTIEEVARRYGISRNHLMKVAQTLVQAGFIGGVRGRGGGVRLRVPGAAAAAGCGSSSRPAPSTSARWCGRPRTASLWSSASTASATPV